MYISDAPPDCYGEHRHRLPHRVKTHNLHRATFRLPPRQLFLLMQTIQPEGTWCDRQVNRNMWSVTSTPPISIGHSPTPKCHLQHRGLGLVTVKQTKMIWSTSVKQQTGPPIRISGLFSLIRMVYYTNKYRTNHDHIRHLYIRCTSWRWWWAPWIDAEASVEVLFKSHRDFG